MDIIDLLVNVGIILTTGYCLVMGYVSIRDWRNKNRRG